jgi:hypothetical protein
LRRRRRWARRLSDPAADSAYKRGGRKRRPISPSKEDHTVAISYQVPGLVPAVAQPNTMACWATVYTMMRSWKDQMDYDIATAVAKVGTKWSNYFTANNGLPPAEFGPFLSAAGMAHEPMVNLGVDGYLTLLKAHGPIWVGTLNAIGPGAGLHSRIIEAMNGDGSVGGTNLSIVDPDGAKKYPEGFQTYISKYEGAIQGQRSEYFQLRYFL